MNVPKPQAAPRCQRTTNLKRLASPSPYHAMVQRYVDGGFQPRPVKPGDKSCKFKGWHEDVPTLTVPRGNYGIGLRLGTAFPDGSYLTAIDADRDEYVRLTRALVSPVSARFGSKGIAIFARLTNECSKFDLKLFDGSRAGEFLGTTSLCVVPPTIHPDTGKPYFWTDAPLLETDWEALPVVDPALIKMVFASEQLSILMGGQLTHDAMVKFVGELAQLTDDFGYIERVVSACFPDDYTGNSLKELPGLLRDTAKKFESGKWVRKRAYVGGFPDLAKDGKPRASLPNTKKAIELLGVECRYDLFKLQYSINGHNLDSYMTEAISDPALLRLREMIYDNYGFDPNTEIVHTAVQTLANHHRFHPVLDYLNSLVWDKQPRLDQWLVNYAGAEDTPYIKAVGSIVLIAAVRRVRQPGVKFDEWLVLEGEQGSSKSQALRILAVQPEWFTDQKVIGLSGRDSIEQFSGKWIIEAGELHGMRNSDIESIKAFMSRDTDRGRMAYARTVTESKRQCVIIGTTNSENYLRDLTGNRRFWPVVTGTFDLETLRRDRDQLWAEAAARETIGESIRLPEALWPAAAAEQQRRVIHNPFTSILEEVLREPDEPIRDKVTNKITGTKIGGPMTGIITMEGLWTIVDVRPAQRSQTYVENLSAAMKELGWTRTRRRVDGKRSYSYQRGDDPRHIKVYAGTDGIPPMAKYDGETPEETITY